jgi:hypothetical protein
MLHRWQRQSRLSTGTRAYGYPAQHDGIVIDKCNPSAWLPEEQVTPAKLQAATAAVFTGSTADLRLARGPGDAHRRGAGQGRPSTLRALFKALDRCCNG